MHPYTASIGAFSSSKIDVALPLCRRSRFSEIDTAFRVVERVDRERSNWYRSNPRSFGEERFVGLKKDPVANVDICNCLGTLTNRNFPLRYFQSVAIKSGFFFFLFFLIGTGGWFLRFAKLSFGMSVFNLRPALYNQNWNVNKN